MVVYSSRKWAWSETCLQWDCSFYFSVKSYYNDSRANTPRTTEAYTKAWFVYNMWRIERYLVKNKRIISLPGCSFIRTLEFVEITEVDRTHHCHQCQDNTDAWV